MENESVSVSGHEAQTRLTETQAGSRTASKLVDKQIWQTNKPKRQSQSTFTGTTLAYAIGFASHGTMQSSVFKL